MRLIINNNNFTDIGTVVFYSQNDLDNREYSKVQYRSNSSLLYDRDFSEYNFLYEITKDKFNDDFLVNYLGEKTLSLIGKNSNSLEKIESNIFPTLSRENWIDNDKYFGTTLISNQIFALFKAGIGIKRLELYEGVIDRNNTKGKSKFIDTDSLSSLEIEQTATPNFILILGESSETDEVSNLVVEKELQDEISGEKMIWMLISNNSEVEKVNLSYKSWVDSINPNRNMNKYLIRNDEYWSTKDSVGIVETIQDLPEILIDTNSGTLLGNEKIDESKLLILKNKKTWIEQFKGSNKYLNYFPYTTYKIGDKVILGDKVWESVANNNFNNNPVLSSKWILSEYLNINKPIRVVVSITPENGGTCNPIGIISIPTTKTAVNFRIYPKPGYKLNEDIPCLLDEKNLIPLPPSNNFSYNVPNDLVTVINWEEILTTNHLIFNLKYIGSYIILKAIISGESTIYNYDDWVKLNESNFRISELIIGEDSSERIEYDPYVSNEGRLDVLINERAELRIPELSRYVISRVLVEYENIEEGESSSEIYYPVQIDNTSSIIIPKVNFSFGTFILELSNKKVTISIIEFTGFEISNNSLKINSGSNATFKFITNNYPDSNLEKVILEDSQGNSLTINRFSANGGVQNFGASQVSLKLANSKTPEEGEYTLKLMNIYYDTTIKLIRK